MNCSACGRENRDGASFCTFCGAGLVSRCRSCGTDLHAEARFCDACGTPVASEPEAKPVAAARKVVTVLFADMTGSTSLEEGMDAESVRSLLDRFYATLRAEVDKRGGRVVKFTGDGVMAAFGVPEVHEDDAVRALDAAMAMCAACERLASETNVPSLALKVGINTGEVVVLEDDDDVVGDTVNVAARLENAAHAGEVLVGEGTWRLTRATSSYEPTEPLVLKGKSEPVPAYRLLSLEEAAESVSTPFVGRQAEIDKLLAAFDDAVATNSARLVTIVGSPGLGKTRLAQECLASLSDRARVRETRCDPAGSTTFAPIAEALRGAASIPDTADEDAIVAALEALIPGDDPDRSRIAMRAASVLGAGQAGSTEETFWAIRRLIEIAAGTRPVVLVLDDLHWAEPLLLDLVEHLTEWIRNAPVLLIGTGRPELRDLRPSFAEGGRAAAVIALEGLDGDDTARLALGLLGTDHAPSELLARIPSSTEGNPLFVRELVRMLVDDGVLRRDGDEWRVTVDVDAIEVPPTIQSLLAARMDRLRPDERTVVELASVVGKEFYRGAVHALAPASVRGQIDSCLESLRRKELVEPVGTYWIDEPVFRFHHALIRDAAYRRLLKEVRVDLHERVAAWLEEKTEGIVGEHDETVGYHLEQAHEYLRQLGRLDDRGVEIGRRAASLLSTAASRALDRDDVPAAATLSGRALDCLPADDDARAELLLVRCEALLSMGDVTNGAPAVAELERVADGPRLTAWAACFAGQLAGFTNPERLQDTEARVAAAAAELAALGDSAGAAKAHTVHASTLAKRGRFAECESVLDDALMAARAAKDRRRITATLGMLPHAQLWGPNPVSRAGGRCLDVVRLLRITTGSPAVEATSRRCQAVLEAFRGRTDAARGMLRSAERKLTELGLHHELLEAEQFAGIIELIAGDAPAAETHLRASYEGLRKTGADVLAAQSAALLARAYLLMGEDDEADALVRTSEELAGLDLRAAIDGRSVKAELLARRGSFEEARRVAEAAVTLAEQTDGLFDHGNACRSLAAVCRAMGDASGARSADDRAASLYERKGATALMESTGAEAVRPVVATAQSDGPPPNRAAGVVMSGTSFDSLTPDAIAALYANDAVWTDKRPGLGTRLVGREIVDNFVAVRGIGAARTELSLVATRGERLALLRTRLTGGDDESAFEVVVLGVGEIDESDRIASMTIFDPDDFGAAMAELDARFIAGEGASFEDVLRVAAQHTESLNARDWQGLRALFADDAVTVDHRPVSMGVMRADERIESWKELARLYPFRQDRIAYHALESDRVLFTGMVRGQTSDGAAVESTLLGLLQARGRLIVRFEFFPIDQLEAARARFEELGPRPETRLDNDCVRLTRRMWDCLLQEDWEGVDSCYARDIHFEDRRSGLSATLTGAESNLENLKVLWSVGARRVSIEVIGVRGERLAVCRFIVRAFNDSPEGFSAEVLSVNEINEDGLFRKAAAFDADAFYEAMALLNEWYLEDEGAAYADVLNLWLAVARAAGERDRDAFRQLFTDDFVLVDHRPAAWGEVRGVDGLIDHFATFAELVRDSTVYVAALHAISENATLMELESHALTLDGSHIQQTLLILTLRRGELVCRQEQFLVDQMDLAHARFDELSRPARRLENECTRVGQREWDYYLQQDWDRMRALYDENVVSEDRRSGLIATFRGPQEIVENFQALSTVGANRTTITPLAIRGDRLALNRITVGTDRDAGGFEAEVLGVSALNDKNLHYRGVALDADAFDEALEILDTWYAEDEGAPYAEVLRALGHGRDVAAETDWNEWRESLAPDFVFVDRTPAGRGELDRDGYLDSIKPLVGLTQHWVAYRAVIHVLTHNGAVTETVLRGETNDGSAVEMVYQAVTLVRDALWSRLEFFPADQLDAALVRFDELTRAETPAERAQRLVNECLVRRDWEGARDLHRDDVTWEDRRPGLQMTISGIDARMDHLRAAAEVGLHRATATTVATRGDRLALSRVVAKYETDDSFESDMLFVYEVDDDGLVVAGVVLDGTKILDAVAELDRRFVLRDGKHATALLDLWSRFTHAYSSGDWVAFRDVFTSDLVVVDHRPASAGTRSGPDAFVSYIRELVELLSDVNVYASDIPALEADRGLFRVEVLGYNEVGGEVHIPLLVRADARGDRIAHLEAFPPDEINAARAVFESKSRPEAVLENACVRGARRFAQLFAQDDWAEMTRLMSSEDYLFEDRRPGLATVIRDGEEGVENLRALKAVGVDELPFIVVATRGDTLALCRYVLHGRDPDASFAAETLVVNEVGEGGEMLSGIVFEPEDLDAAFDELEERYIASEGQPFSEPLRLSAAVARTYRAHDWPAFRSVLHHDVVVHDHRPAGAGMIEGADEAVRYTEGFVELAPDARFDVLEIIRIAPDRTMALTRIHGTTEDGGDVERLYFAVLAVRDGLVGRYEHFAIEDREAAIARFEELNGQLVQELDNPAALAFREMIGRMIAADWAAYAAYYAEDAFWEDRRKIVQMTTVGRDEIVESAKAMMSMGAGTFDTTTLATRGRRLALARVAVRPQGDYVVELLRIIELDGDDLVARMITFEPDDLDAAYAELDERYADGEGSAYREPVLVQSRLSRAINQRRWDDFADLLDPGLVIHDHRPASLGEIAAADWPAAMDALADVIENYRSEQQFFHAVASDRWWLQLHNRGESEDGGEVDFSFQSVGQVRDGRIVRLEIFSDTQTDDARALFQELAGND